MTAKVDLTGRSFGRLTVLHEVPAPPDYRATFAQWWCRCACGNEKRVAGHVLRNGHTKSCGCLMREMSRIRGKRKATVTPQQIGLIIHYRLDGLTYKDIACKVGCTYDQAHHYWCNSSVYTPKYRRVGYTQKKTLIEKGIPDGR